MSHGSYLIIPDKAQTLPEPTGKAVLPEISPDKVRKYHEYE